MRILFDQGTPVPLRAYLVGHSVTTAHEMGWAGLDNGDLLRAAEAQFDALITTDQSLPYQQNLSKSPLAILALMTTSWPRIRPHVAKVAATVNSLRPGEYRELDFP